MKSSEDHPHLRHRRNSGSKQQQQQQVEITPLLSSKREEKPSGSSNNNNNKQKQSQKQHKQQQPSDATDGYLLIPLQERSIISRLDVGPFLIIYLLLIVLDYHNHSIMIEEISNNTNTNMNEQPSFLLYLLGFYNYNNGDDNISPQQQFFMENDDTNIILLVLVEVLFPIVLILHFSLFLLQQWDVFWRAFVGYHKLSMTIPNNYYYNNNNATTANNNKNNNTSSSSSSSSSLFTNWTHCLVEAPHMDKHHSSHNAGIVSITIHSSSSPIPSLQKIQQQQQNEQEERSKEVAVVNFQDVIFRCCLTTNNSSNSTTTDPYYGGLDQTISNNNNNGVGGDIDEILWYKATEEEEKETEETKNKSSSLSSSNDNNNNNNNSYSYLSFHRLKYPIHLPISFYKLWNGHTNVSNILIAQQAYGTNTTPIQLPPFIELLLEQVVAPFFLFQIFCVLLWSLDEYWYYAIFTFFALLMFESTVAYNRLQGLQRLRSHTGQDSQRRRIWVYRPSYPPTTNAWIEILCQELLPGDIISLKAITNLGNNNNTNHTAAEKAAITSTTMMLNRVPADIVVLEGDAVVDEALLTGESIPQLKVALEETTFDDDNSKISTTTSNNDNNNNNTNDATTTTTTSTARTSTTLDLQEHKQSILFGGTTLLVSHGRTMNDSTSSSTGNNKQQKEKTSSRPIPPDRGVIGMVLRTGFDTAQGSLLRTMAHTQKSVDGIHTKDTYVFIVLLLCCAISSASMVWIDGWNDPTRNKFRLILHVIIIITSVVPPELPMELSLAVTNSVADLMKRCQVYCTEVFRIPLAGQVTICCFDKTGTLTSDEMQLQGIRLVKNSIYDENENSKSSKTTTTTTTTAEFGIVYPIIGKNNTIEENNNNDKDVDTTPTLPWPVVRIMAACHSLALNGMTPKRKDTMANVIGDPLEKAVLKETGYRLIQNNALRSIEPPTTMSDVGGGSSSSSSRPNTILILHRYGFSSRLKRMSVIVKEDNNDSIYVLTKGAPETIKQYLLPESIPSNFDEMYMYHMALGQRVLAIGYKQLLSSSNNISTIKTMNRNTIECDLIFAGFLLLDCPLKSDSLPIISELHKSGHDVVMITGDAVLTAAEVARQVGIIRKNNNNKNKKYSSSSSSYPITYQLVEQKTYEPEVITSTSSPTSSSSIIPSEDDDMLSGFCFVPLGGASQDNKGDDDTVQKLNQKRPLSFSGIKDLQKIVTNGDAALCVSGDMLLKLAVAIMRKESSSTMMKKDEKHILLHPSVQAVLKDLVPLISVFARHAPRQKEAVVAAFNHGGHCTLMCGDGTNDVGALRRAHVGISIISAPGVESKQRSATEKLSRLKAEQKRERKADKKKGKKSSSNRRLKSTSALEESLRQLQEAQEELDYVELGDASIASPFTSRTVSIKCCKDVLQQGRCTLVTMLQIYKILGVNCLVNAMVLSKLFLHGVKQGDRQLTILGIAVAALFLFVTRGKPLPTLSPTRPPTSVLCIQALLSIAVQFGIHFVAIVLATEVALSFVDPYDPSMIPDGPFNPNTLNTCTFLMNALATVNTFAVNYRGRPFMEDLSQNKLLIRSLQVCYGVLFASAFEVFPPLNDLLQLTEFPTTDEDTATWRVVSSFRSDGGDDASSSTVTTMIVSILIPFVESVGLPTFICLLMVCDTVLAFSADKFIIRTFH